MLTSAGTAGAQTEPYPWVAPDIVGGKVRNSAEVTLHRGSAPITFRTEDPAHGSFDSRDVNDLVHPKRGDGVSVRVFAGHSADLNLQQAHVDLVGSCRYRLNLQLGEFCSKLSDENEDEGARITAMKKKIMKDRSKPYASVIKELQAVEQFQHLEFPFCYVKIPKGSYDWSELVTDPTPTNPHHCLLELIKPTPVGVIDAMARCKDGNWLPCPYMLKAAAEPIVDPRTRDVDGRNATAITRVVWNALDYLMLEFEQGCDLIGVQEAFEICVYRSRIEQGELRFKQQSYSGLQNEARLAAFVELAQHLDFWVENYETRMFIEHDVMWALRTDTTGVRIVRSSFVALFDSGIHAHTSQDVPNFQKLPEEGISLLIKLLRIKNITDVCARLQDTVKTMLHRQDDNPELDWSSLISDNEEREAGFSDAVIVADLIQNRMLVQPVAAAGSAIFMATYISEEVSAQLEQSLKRSGDVQHAFAVVMELSLISTFGVFEDESGPRERATNFITAVKAVVNSPEQLRWKIGPPRLDDAVSVGVIRLPFPLTTNKARELGTCLHNLMVTMNSAVWRIASRHRVWCTSQQYGFSLSQAVLGNRSRATSEDKTNADKWAGRVFDASKQKFQAVGIEFEDENYLRAKSPNLTSFIILVTWDETLCRRALSTFENDGLQRLGQIKIDYRTHWTVDI